MKWLHPFIFTIFALGSSHADPRAILDFKMLPPQGETLVWSPLFQASWDKLEEKHTGKLIKVDPPNPLITQLSQFKWQQQQVMPLGGYAIYAGLDTPLFARQTAADVKRRFNFEMDTSQLPQTGQGYAYYGVLVRDLTFKKQFYRSKKKPLSFKNSKNQTYQVRFFGTAKLNSGGYGKNVRILRNTPDKNTFILTINTDKAKEQIIIYCPEKAPSFHTAIQHVLDAKNNPADGKYGTPQFPYLVDHDVIKIPYIKINAHTDLTNQLKGKRYYEGETLPWSVTRAYQITRFDLFEKGARIRLQTGMDDAFGGSPDPRQFVCDKPFFVFAWRDDAKLPYFAAWIDSLDVLIPFSP